MFFNKRKIGREKPPMKMEMTDLTFYCKEKNTVQILTEKWFDVTFDYRAKISSPVKKSPKPNEKRTALDFETNIEKKRRNTQQKKRWFGTILTGNKHRPEWREQKETVCIGGRLKTGGESTL